MYEFNTEQVYNYLCSQWKAWSFYTQCQKYVLGISGGKDSTIIAKIAADKFGRENVYGVMMPNGDQRDLDDAKRVFDITGINRLFVNIKAAYDDIAFRVETSGSVPFRLSNDSRINLAPRIRMSVLYAVAQTVGGIVLNTDNLSEIVLGYYTIFGDGAGTYGPLRDLTVTEVLKIGDYLGLPSELVHKTPGDGLQADGDEARFGFSYADLDRFIRTGEGDKDTVEKIMVRYHRNQFKTQIVNIPSPAFWFNNHVEMLG